MVKDTEIILPKTDKDTGRPYLSYSQYSTWKKSKREYMRQYFFGEKFLGSDYTEFGSEIGEALENNNFSNYTAKEQEFLKTIPRYDDFERKICLNMGTWDVIGFIDTSKNPPTSIADYKTGDIVKKESEYQSDDYIQLDIYAAAIEQETGILPEEVKVFLIDRKGNAYAGEKLKLGDKFVTITKSVDEARIKDVIKRVTKVAHEISEHYKLFLQLNGLR